MAEGSGTPRALFLVCEDANRQVSELRVVLLHPNLPGLPHDRRQLSMR
jgi:hypothetical protein